MGRRKGVLDSQVGNLAPTIILFGARKLWVQIPALPSKVIPGSQLHLLTIIHWFIVHSFIHSFWSVLHHGPGLCWGWSAKQSFCPQARLGQSALSKDRGWGTSDRVAGEGLGGGAWLSLLCGNILMLCLPSVSVLPPSFCPWPPVASEVITFG